MMDGTNQRAIESLLSTFRTELKTLLDCTERFHGEYNAQKIDSFLNYIEAYKNFKNISDEQSLAELPHLLRDHAYTWWKFHMNEIKTWNEAVQTLREHFSCVRPAHVIYMEIFRMVPRESQKIEVFLYEILELFAQLPQPQPEESTQIDMIFGMLPPFVQFKVKRNEIKNFAELIDRVKGLNNQKDAQIINYPEHITKNATPNKGMAASVLSLLSRKRIREDNNEKDTTKQSMEAVRESRIQVRRTEDLVGQIGEVIAVKVTESQQEFNAVDGAQQSETINAVSDVVKTEPEFQIDSDLMHQINNIIESYDREENPSVEIMENASTNNEESIHDLPHLTNSAQINNLAESEANNNNNINSQKFTGTLISLIEPSSPPKKNRLRIRCNFCHHNGHLSGTCFKKKALITGLEALKQDQPTTQSSENLVATAISMNTVTVAGVDESFEKQTSSISKFSSSHTSPSEGCSTSTTKITSPGGSSDIQPPSGSNYSFAGSSESQTSSTVTITTNNAIIEIAGVSSKGQIPLISKFTPPISSASEGHATLTTKLIPTGEVKPKHTIRTLAKNLTDSDSPAPKCHQCGMVGFYRSICPNCSPIYFYKPCRNNNNQ